MGGAFGGGGFGAGPALLWVKTFMTATEGPALLLVDGLTQLSCNMLASTRASRKLGGGGVRLSGTTKVFDNVAGELSVKKFMVLGCRGGAGSMVIAGGAAVRTLFWPVGGTGAVRTLFWPVGGHGGGGGVRTLFWLVGGGLRVRTLLWLVGGGLRVRGSIRVRVCTEVDH